MGCRRIGPLPLENRISLQCRIPIRDDVKARQSLANANVKADHIGTISALLDYGSAALGFLIIKREMFPLDAQSHKASDLGRQIADSRGGRDSSWKPLQTGI
jgi:hypothetical protein